MMEEQVEEAGRSFGDYELVEVLARGGMGVVYRARQRSLNRIVALKMIRAGDFASDAERKRFQAEAEAVAQLDHPNIVPIYEVGEYEGQPFFTMKLMEGGSLADRCSAFRASGSGLEGTPTHTEHETPNAKLISTVARAVHYAHQRGILHRDLKPANILLDSQGTPQLSDFGLAKRVESSAELTLSGAALGTPNYMAPEQAAGKSRGITVAADVYSLGAILYELLAGRPPFSAETPFATMRAVVGDEPTRPSEIRSQVNRDLETICLKCLEKEPTRRYSNAEALSEDLERWLRHEPIQARPSNVWVNMRKWIRRRPALASVLGVSLTAVIGFVVLLLAGSARLERERNHAVDQELITKENLYAADMALAFRARAEGNIGLARRTLEAHGPKPGEPDRRGFEWRYLWNQCQGEQTRIISGHTGAVSTAVFSRDGTLIASGGAGAIRIWRTADFQSAAVIDVPTNEIENLSFSADGRYLAAATADGSVQLFDWNTGRVVFPFRLTPGLVAFSPVSNVFSIATSTPFQGATGQSQRLYHLRRGVEQSVFKDAVGRGAFSYDGQWFASSTSTNIKIWNQTDRRVVRELRDSSRVAGVKFSPDGKWLAAFPAEGRQIQLWSVAEARLAGECSGHVGRVLAVDFSPDNRWLVSASADQTARLWEVATRREATLWSGHGSEVRSAAFAPDGSTAITAGKDGTVRVWSVSDQSAASVTTKAFAPLAVSPDGTKLAAQASSSRETNLFTVLWDVATGRPQTNLATGMFYEPTFSGDGKLFRTLARARPAQTLRITSWDTLSATQSSRVSLPESRHSRTATAASPDGRWLAAAESRGVIHLWEANGSTPARALHGHEADVKFMVFSADGGRLCSYDANAELKCWDTAASHERGTHWRLSKSILALALSADGRQLASSGSDNDIHLWNTETATEQFILAGHREPVSALAFSADNRTLASSSADGALKLWSLATRRELATLDDSRRAVFIRFTSDGRTLITADSQGELRFWRGPK